KALGKGRNFSPHGLRHTLASRGTNLKWIQATDIPAAPLSKRLYASPQSDARSASLARKEQRTAALAGAPGRNRTCDPLLRRQPLCPLSYRGAAGRGSVAPRAGRTGAFDTRAARR